MIDLDHGAFCVELDAILASARDSVCASNHHLMGNSDAGAEPLSGADPRPNIVAGASSQNAHVCEGNMVSGNTCADEGQYADTTPSHTPASQITSHHPSAHQQPHDTSNISSSQQEKREGAAWKIAARQYSTSASNDPAQHRPSRRVAANLNKVALKKTWHGTKSQQRRDRLNEAEKFSASVWSTFAAKGSAVSLNLGISRETMLRAHTDPKRRMTQNLSKHLSEAGFSQLPYAFVFELTPSREGKASQATAGEISA